MITKNALSVTASNIKLVIKLIVFFLIILVIFFALTVAAINPLREVLAEAMHAHSIDFGDNIINDGNIDLGAILSNVSASVREVMDTNPSQIVYTVLMLCLIFYLIKFLSGLCHLPAAKIIAGQMTTGYTDNFLTTFVANFKSTLLFSFMSSLVFLVIDLPISVFIVYMCALIIPTIGIFAIPIGLFVFSLIYSIRLALLAQWLPRIAVSGEPVAAAFVSSVRDVPYSFQRYFPGMFIITLSSVILIITTAIFTVALSLLLFMPLTIVLITSFSSVVYCRQIKQNYFVDSNTVVEIKEDILE